MAYLANNLTENELKKQQTGQQSGGTNFAPQGGGSLLGSGGGTAPQSKAVAQSPSGSWTNLQSYLDSNQQQSGDLANQVAGNITNIGNQAQGAVDTGLQNYTSNLNQNAPDMNLISQAQADPVTFAKDKNNVSLFNQMRTGTLANPQEFQSTPDYAKISQQVQKASLLPSQVGTDSGKQELLRGVSPTMNQGEFDLNNLLLSGNSTANQTLTNAAKPFSNLNDYLAQQNQTAQKAQADLVKSQDEAKSKIANEFTAPQTKNLQKMESDITNRKNQASQDWNKNQAINDVNMYITGQSNHLAPNDYSAFGVDFAKPQRDSQAINPTYDTIINPMPLTTDEFTALRNEGGDAVKNWMQYFPGTQMGSDATLNNIATPEEYAKVLALQQLTGATPFYNEQNQSQAGTYRPATIGKFKNPKV